MLREDVLEALEADAEALRERGEHAPHLHLAEAWKAGEAGAEVGGVARLRPDPLGAAAVVVDDGPREILDALRHRAGVAVQRGLAPEDLVELPGVRARDRLRVEGAKAPLQLERRRERLLHRHLLVEREADEERERFLSDERVGLVVAREVEPVRGRYGHGSILQVG